MKKKVTKKKFETFGNSYLSIFLLTFRELPNPLFTFELYDKFVVRRLSWYNFTVILDLNISIWLTFQTYSDVVFVIISVIKTIEVFHKRRGKQISATDNFAGSILKNFRDLHEILLLILIEFSQINFYSSWNHQERFLWE